MSAASGASLAPTRRFGDRADDYARHRPSYPPEAVAAAIDGLGGPTGLRVIDVGAGTGISSRLFADAGCTVTALEPNGAMRAAGEREPHPRVEWRGGTGEQTGLPDASADLVACCQAFHWLDAPRALAEFARVLRPLGRVALIWNTRMAGDAATDAYYDTVARFATEPPTSPWAARDETRFVGPLRDHPAFAGFRARSFHNTQRLDREGLIGRAKSASYAPKDGPRAEALHDALNEVFDRFAVGGAITLTYAARVTLAERST